ncbi:hypothetical protein GQ600_25563 [Phytophthora cactorum]|nr:hypothetical protein GQ600_25563 [Phytophthora cactorum]
METNRIVFCPVYINVQFPHWCGIIFDFEQHIVWKYDPFRKERFSKEVEKVFERCFAPIMTCKMEIRTFTANSIAHIMGLLRSRVSYVAAVCAAVCLSATPEAEAYKMFQKKVPNGGNVPGVEAIGHERAGGGPNNDFGLDFIEAMFKWTKTFCEKDSDGDGQTNGQELGDPCYPELKSDPKLWESIVCGADAVEPEVVEVAEPEATEAEAAEPEAAEEKEVEEKKKDAVMQAAVHSTKPRSADKRDASVYRYDRGLCGVFSATGMGYSCTQCASQGDKVPGVTALGHLDPVLAGPMNEFGMDMIDADFHWTKEFCMKDSDGDGQTTDRSWAIHAASSCSGRVPSALDGGRLAPWRRYFMSDPKLWREWCARSQ